MQIWTNNYWKSTLHRVVNTTANTDKRQSLAFFFNPDNDKLIQPIYNIKKNNKFKPIKAKDYILKKHLKSIK